MRKSSLATEILDEGDLEYSNLLEHYQDCLRPGPERGRKLSFIDLMSTAQGVPDILDLPNFDSVPKDIEFFQEQRKSNDRTEKLLSLDLCMPQEQPCRPARRTPAIIIRAPAVSQSLMVGNLTYEERQIKLQKYLEKRRRRSWKKRISYHCRKRVADNRLRVKGRFVTKDQAILMLGVDSELVKNLLANK